MSFDQQTHHQQAPKSTYVKITKTGISAESSSGYRGFRVEMREPDGSGSSRSLGSMTIPSTTTTRYAEVYSDARPSRIESTNNEGQITIYGKPAQKGASPQILAYVKGKFDPSGNFHPEGLSLKEEKPPASFSVTSPAVTIASATTVVEPSSKVPASRNADMIMSRDDQKNIPLPRGTSAEIAALQATFPDYSSSIIPPEKQKAFQLWVSKYKNFLTTKNGDPKTLQCLTAELETVLGTKGISAIQTSLLATAGSKLTIAIAGQKSPLEIDVQEDLPSSVVLSRTYASPIRPWGQNYWDDQKTTRGAKTLVRYPWS